MEISTQTYQETTLLLKEQMISYRFY